MSEEYTQRLKEYGKKYNDAIKKVFYYAWKMNML